MEKKEEDIIAGNRLIAEFMGAETKNKGKGDFLCGEQFFNTTPYWDDDIEKFGIYDGYILPEHLKYHTSWDWLMPVVEKIEDIRAIGAQAYINITAFKIEAYCSGHLERKLAVFSYKEEGRRFPGKEKIEAVHRCVIQFITWYNTQSSQTTKP